MIRGLAKLAARTVIAVGVVELVTIGTPKAVKYLKEGNLPNKVRTTVGDVVETYTSIRNKRQEQEVENLVKED